MSSFIIFCTFLFLLQFFKRTRNKAFSEPRNTFLGCVSAKPYQNVWARTYGYFYGRLWPWSTDQHGSQVEPALVHWPTWLSCCPSLINLVYQDPNVTCRDFTCILSRPALSRADSLTYLDLMLTCLLRISVSGVPGASSSCHCHSGSPVAVSAFAL